MSAKEAPEEVGAARQVKEVGALHPGRMLATACAVQLLLIADSTASSVMVVQVGASFDLGPASLSWVINTFTLAFGGLLLVGGRLADRWGQALALRWGLVGFAAASLVCVIAPTVHLLLAARAAQGVAAALLAPATLGLVAVAYPDTRDRLRAVAVVGVVSAVIGSIGGAGGGALAEFGSWRVTYALEVVLAVVAFAVSVWGTRHAQIVRDTVPLGLFAVLSGAATVGSVIFVLQGYGGPVLWGLPVLLGLLFVLADRRTPNPVWPRRDPQRPAPALPVAVVLVTGAGMINAGLFFVLALTLQGSWGWGPTANGVLFIPFGLALLAGSWTGPRVLGRVSQRTMVRAATGLMAVGLLGMSAAQPSRSVPVLVGGMVVVAFGSGWLTLTLTSLGLQGTTATTASGAGALISVAQQVGAALGVGLAAVGAARSIPAAAMFGCGIALIALLGMCGAAVIPTGMVRTSPSSAADRDRIPQANAPRATAPVDAPTVPAPGGVLEVVAPTAELAPESVGGPERGEVSR